MNSNGGSKSRPRTASTGKAANNGAGPYLIVSFLFVAMFLGLIAYLVYFNVVRKEEFLNSSYNTRQNNYAERVIRGTIYSADGQELACLRRWLATREKETAASNLPTTIC